MLNEHIVRTSGRGSDWRFTCRCGVTGDPRPNQAKAENDAMDHIIREAQRRAS